jgi:hypothetical protein
MASATKTVQKHYKKFCSYCKAKGLPESAFTSHFVKDKPGKGGKVCCPELLKNECGYCHEIGHTPRFCPKLKARDARRKAAAKRAKAPRAKPVARNANGAAPTKVTNLFEALAGYSTPEKPKEAFPALTRAPKKAPAPQGVWGGANALSVAQLEQLLAQKRAAAAQLSDVEQAFIDAQLEKQSQTLEETADGEAFFDNNLDAEDAVERVHRSPAQVALRRSPPNEDVWDDFLTDAGDGKSMSPLPIKKRPKSATKSAAIALPPCCNLDADFGAEPSGDGWGSDCDE